MFAFPKTTISKFVCTVILVSCTSGSHEDGSGASDSEKDPPVKGDPILVSALTAGGMPVYSAYQPVEISLQGPMASEMDDPSTNGLPNPFLNFRLFAVFKRQGVPAQFVPGFFDGDGSGGGAGNVWKIRWVPNAPGLWTVGISFRKGATAAESLALQTNYQFPNFDGVEASPLDQATATMGVRRPDPHAPGFFSKGNLEYVGGHYARFSNGDWWVKGGANSPENFLGYLGFDHVTDLGGASTGVVHEYAPHLADFNGDGPAFSGLTSGYGSAPLCGALNYLASTGANSVYFLPMNLGGDGQETCPFVGYGNNAFNKSHYDISRMHQWNQIFRHAQEKGILLTFVLAEKESNNISWLDGGDFGNERKLFFRELIARFGYLPATKWTLCEENVFSIQKLRDMAAYLQDLDYRNRLVAVHTWQDNFNDYSQILGDPNFTCASIQYTPAFSGAYAEQWRTNSANAGHPWIVEMDENGQIDAGNWGINSGNLDFHRKLVLYATLFSGGGLEWYCGGNASPGGGDTSLEDFRTRHDMWVWTGIATRFLREHLPFSQMVPMDGLVHGENPAFGGAQVFAKPGSVYAVYFPNASAADTTIDLSASAGSFFKRWFNPRTGQWVGGQMAVAGGGVVTLGLPPESPGEDWVVLFEKN